VWRHHQRKDGQAAPGHPGRGRRRTVDLFSARRGAVAGGSQSSIAVDELQAGKRATPPQGPGEPRGGDGLVVSHSAGPRVHHPLRLRCRLAPSPRTIVARAVAGRRTLVRARRGAPRPMCLSRRAALKAHDSLDGHALGCANCIIALLERCRPSTGALHGGLTTYRHRYGTLAALWIRQCVALGAVAAERWNSSSSIGGDGESGKRLLAARRPEGVQSRAKTVVSMSRLA